MLLSMEELLNNHGLDIITVNIVKQLDYVSLKNCSRVSTSFKTFIETQRPVWLNQLKLLKSHAFFQYGRWIEVCNHLEKSCNVQKIQRFVHVMQDFLQNGGLSVIQYDSEIELEYFPFAFFARRNKIGGVGLEVGARKIHFLYECFESIDENYTFWMASGYGTAANLKYLLRRNCIDYDGFSDIGFAPFINACYLGNLEAVKVLLQLPGIDLDVEDHNGQTGFVIACEYKYIRIVKHILKNISKTRNRINFNVRGMGGKTALINACEKGHFHIVEAILNASVHLSINLNADKNGFTAFHIACEEGHTSIVRSFLKHSHKCDIDINRKTDGDWTALMIASWFGHEKIIKLLLESTSYESNIMALDENGKTALHHAGVNKTIVNLLVSHHFEEINS